MTWTGEGPFSLVENGTVLYAGADAATTVTGRTAGTYAYTVADATGAKSAACTVEVAPPSLPVASGMFGLGGLVFGAVIVAIVRGRRAIDDERRRS